MNNRRTRIVNFRVTEEEYERLRSASHALGPGGISGYARQATLYLAGPHSGEDHDRPASTPEQVFACLADLTTRVAELELKVGRLVRPSSEAMTETCV